MNPYGRTSGILVAVVNLDQGAAVRGTPIDVRSQVVTSLKKSHDIGWVFVDERKAMQGAMHRTTEQMALLNRLETAAITGAICDRHDA